MAHTVDVEAGPFRQHGWDETLTRLSGLTSGNAENVLHGGPSGASVVEVRMVPYTRPTDNSVVNMVWEAANDSTTNNTCSLRFYSSSGNLAGFVCQVFFSFRDAASGGIG